MNPNKDAITSIDIAVYALFLLGGWQNRIHTEDIAMKCFELMPSKFSWVKYPQYPDPTTARYALESAKKSGLVAGGSERKKDKNTFTGWRLSQRGMQWIKENQSIIETALKSVIPPKDRLFEDRRLKGIMKSQAYNDFLKDGDKASISYASFVESILCTVNTKTEIIIERIEQLSSAADLLRQADIKNYLNYCKKTFLKTRNGGNYE